MSKIGIKVLSGLKILVRNNVISDKVYLSLRYYMTFKKIINWKNPRSLNEKLQVYKLLISGHPKYSEVADKLAVREWVSRRVSILFPRVIFQTTTPESYEFEALSDPIVIKANHGSGWYDIVRDPKEISDWNERRKQYRKWLGTNFYYESIEPQYNNIAPVLFGEEMMIPSDGKDIIDYKFHCINGKLAFIHVASERTGATKRNFFDRQWKEIDMYWGPLDIAGQPARSKNDSLKRPENLDEMIEIACELAKEFPYVRVDLYSFNRNIYFGELTFHPGAGLESFMPAHYDLKYGAQLKLSSALL